MRRDLKVAAWIGIASLVLAACGSRVVPLAQGTAAIDPNTGQPIGAGGVQPGGAAGGSAAGGTAAPGAGGSGGTGGAGGGGGAVTSCTGTRNSNPSEGFTATEIKFGQVVAIGGPLPGQFTSALDAAQAYTAMINAAGGICGRKLVHEWRNDDGDAKQNESRARELAAEEKVMAFVGSASAPDDRGVGRIAAQYKIPDIGFPLSFDRGEQPYTFGVPGSVKKNIIGAGASGSGYLTQLHKIRQIAILWVVEADVSPQSAWAFEAAMLKNTRSDDDPDNDIEICYEGGASVFSNFRPFVANIKAACPTNKPLAVYSVMENNANIRLADAMRRDGLQYEYFSPTWTSYTPSYINNAEIRNGRRSTDGSYLALYSLPVERCARGSNGRPVPPCKNPQLDRYMAALARYKPRAQPGTFGAAVWAQMDLFTRALASCGNTISRACLLDYVKRLDRFSADGLVTSNRPAAQMIYNCDLIVKVQGDRFVELPAPSGWRAKPDAPAFWDCSKLFDWWEYYCENKSQFPPNPQRENTVKC